MPVDSAVLGTVIGSQPVYDEMAVAVAEAVRVTLPFVTVAVHVPPFSTSVGTMARMRSPSVASQLAIVMNGVTAFLVLPGSVVSVGVGSGDHDGTALGVGDAEADALGASLGVDGSTTLDASGDDVATGDGATWINEHEVSATAAATETAAAPPARSTTESLCSPTRPG